MFVALKKYVLGAPFLFMIDNVHIWINSGELDFWNFDEKRENTDRETSGKLYQI